MSDPLHQIIAELEPLATEHSELLEQYATGRDGVSLKQIDQKFREMKPLIKQLRQAARNNND